MKHWIIYLLAGTATFFLGLTPQLLFKPQETTTQRPPAVTVEPVRQNPKVTPLKETPLKVRNQSPPHKINLDYDPTRFNPRGGYYLIGRKPKGIPEFDCLALAVGEFKGKAYGDVTIQTYEQGEYRARYINSGLITSTHLSFVSYPDWEDRFVYSFEGEFLRKGTLSKARKHVAVLKGKLRKSKDGVTVAEATIKFRIEYLGC